MTATIAPLAAVAALGLGLAGCVAYVDPQQPGYASPPSYYYAPAPRAYGYGYGYGYGHGDRRHRGYSRHHAGRRDHGHGGRGHGGRSYSDRGRWGHGR